MELSQFDKSRVRYHLGYFTISVPAGDYARLEEAMNTIPDSFFFDKVVLHLDRCDRAEKKTFLYPEDSDPVSTRLETIRGDVDRTIRSSALLQALKDYLSALLQEIEAAHEPSRVVKLCQALGLFPLLSPPIQSVDTL